MLYQGRRPEDLTGDELDAAKTTCWETMRHATEVYDINRAFIVVLNEEQQRRIAAARTVN